MGQLEGKVAIVTGANTGIGRAIAERFAAEGARLVVAGRNDAAVAEAAKAISNAGGAAEACHYDAFSEGDADGVVQFALRTWSRLDICVPNAGGTFGTAPLQDLATDAWRRTMVLNADAVFYLLRAASRAMIPQKSGAIVAISSIASIRASASLHYAASKGAVNAMVMNLSVPLAREGIRINAILPGPTDTRAMRQFMNTPEREQAVAKSIPRGRIGLADEIAALALFLASDEASFVTGQLITADGGVTQK